jgi:hypothetical protein
MSAKVTRLKRLRQSALEFPFAPDGEFGSVCWTSAFAKRDTSIDASFDFSKLITWHVLMTAEGSCSEQSTVMQKFSSISHLQEAPP